MSRWIDKFSEKASALLKATVFPLNEKALQAFNLLKSELTRASLGSIVDDFPFDIETDASDFSIAAVLFQRGKPVAYLSRTLNSSERNSPAVEKEAIAIVKATRE